MMMFRRWTIFLLLLVGASTAVAQSKVDKRRDVSSRADTSRTLKAKQDQIQITIKNIDITHFPDISVIFSAVDGAGQFVRNLKKDDFIFRENGRVQPITSLHEIDVENRVPIDIVFVIDETESMDSIINSVKQDVATLAGQLRQHGFDVHFGLIRFGDDVDLKDVNLTDDVDEFKKWVGAIHAGGGGDVKENALEGLHAIQQLPLRTIALRMAVLVTDAECHQQGEYGDGTTNFTMSTMADWLYEREIKLFTVTPKQIIGYQNMSKLTGGESFDLDSDLSGVFAKLVDNMTSLYSLTYRSQSSLAPDSVRVELLSKKTLETLANDKLIALEPGRRFVFEDLKFAPNQYQLVSEFIPELERIVRSMFLRPTMRIQIEGHADSTGNAASNMALSIARAEAVKRYLMESGIRADRLETKGYGATRPLVSNATEEGRQINRRIEFVILSK